MDKYLNFCGDDAANFEKVGCPLDELEGRNPEAQRLAARPPSA